jgi:hypothetical protein
VSTYQTPAEREPCPDGATQHGPLDGHGRCPWCHLKVGRARSRYIDPSWPQWRDDQEVAYRRTYDPDWGAVHGDTDPRGATGWADQ